MASKHLLSPVWIREERRPLAGSTGWADDDEEEEDAVGEDSVKVNKERHWLKINIRDIQIKVSDINMSSECPAAQQEWCFAVNLPAKSAVVADTEGAVDTEDEGGHGPWMKEKKASPVKCHITLHNYVAYYF